MTMSHSPLLSTRKVDVRFGGLMALTLVDLDVPAGLIYGVIGPNGAGKSTLFSVIAGGLTPTGGQVLLDGEVVSGKPSHAVSWQGVARAFQLANLFPSLTVFENVLVGAERHDHMGLMAAFTHTFGFNQARRDAVERASRALELLEIKGLSDNPVSTLTYGQQRLVATARAVAADPRLLLLDEPAAGLSEADRAVLIKAIRQLKSRGVTIVLIEHDMNLVLSICDRVAVLHFGKKIADGDPDRVREDRNVVEAYLGH